MISHWLFQLVLDLSFPGSSNSLLWLHNTTSVQFSHSVVSDSLRPHEPQHARPPCPSPTPRVYPNPCPLSWWCHPTISSSVVPFSSSFSLNLSQHQVLFKWVSSSHQVAKILSFSFNISASNEHPGLISFRMDWLDLAVQGTLKSLLQHNFNSGQIFTEHPLWLRHCASCSINTMSTFHSPQRWCFYFCFTEEEAEAHHIKEAFSRSAHSEVTTPRLNPYLWCWDSIIPHNLNLCLLTHMQTEKRIPTTPFSWVVIIIKWDNWIQWC